MSSGNVVLLPSLKESTHLHELQHNLEETEGYIHELTKDQVELQIIHEKAREKLIGEFEEIRKALNAREESMLASLDKSYQDRDDRLSKQLEILETHKEKNEQTCDECKDTIATVDNKGQAARQSREKTIRKYCQDCIDDSPVIEKVPIKLYHTFDRKSHILNELVKFSVKLDRIESGKHLPFTRLNSEIVNNQDKSKQTVYGKTRYNNENVGGIPHDHGISLDIPNGSYKKVAAKTTISANSNYNTELTKIKMRCCIKINGNDVTKAWSFYNNDRKKEFTYNCLIAKARKVLRIKKVEDYENKVFSFFIGQNQVSNQQDFEDYCINAPDPHKIEMTARYDDKTDLQVNVVGNVKKTLLPHKNILNPLIIIVSIEKYHNKNKNVLSSRKDYNNWINLFDKHLKFGQNIVKNDINKPLNKNDFLHFLDSVFVFENLRNNSKNYDSIIFTYSGHGTDKDEIYFSNEKTLSLKLLFKKFDGGDDNLQSFVGLPKIFIIDMCRGDNVNIPIRQILKNNSNNSTGGLKYRGGNEKENVLFHHRDNSFIKVFSITQGNASLDAGYLAEYLCQTIKDKNIDLKKTCFHDLVTMADLKIRSKSAMHCIEYISTAGFKTYLKPI